MLERAETPARRGIPPSPPGWEMKLGNRKKKIKGFAAKEKLEIVFSTVDDSSVGIY